MARILGDVSLAKPATATRRKAAEPDRSHFNTILSRALEEARSKLRQPSSPETSPSDRSPATPSSSRGVQVHRAQPGDNVINVAHQYGKSTGDILINNRQSVVDFGWFAEGANIYILDEQRTAYAREQELFAVSAAFTSDRATASESEMQFRDSVASEMSYSVEGASDPVAALEETVQIMMARWQQPDGSAVPAAIIIEDVRNALAPTLLPQDALVDRANGLQQHAYDLREDLPPPAPLQREVSAAWDQVEQSISMELAERTAWFAAPSDHGPAIIAEMKARYPDDTRTHAVIDDAYAAFEEVWRVQGRTHEVLDPLNLLAADPNATQADFEEIISAQFDSAVTEAQAEAGDDEDPRSILDGVINGTPSVLGRADLLRILGPDDPRFADAVEAVRFDMTVTEPAAIIAETYREEGPVAAAEALAEETVHVSPQTAASIVWASEETLHSISSSLEYLAIASRVQPGDLHSEPVADILDDLIRTAEHVIKAPGQPPTEWPFPRRGGVQPSGREAVDLLTIASGARHADGSYDKWLLSSLGLRSAERQETTLLLAMAARLASEGADQEDVGLLLGAAGYIFENLREDMDGEVDDFFEMHIVQNQQWDATGVGANDYDFAAATERYLAANPDEAEELEEASVRLDDYGRLLASGSTAYAIYEADLRNAGGIEDLQNARDKLVNGPNTEFLLGFNLFRSGSSLEQASAAFGVLEDRPGPFLIPGRLDEGWVRTARTFVNDMARTPAGQLFDNGEALSRDPSHNRLRLGLNGAGTVAFAWSFATNLTNTADSWRDAANQAFYSAGLIRDGMEFVANAKQTRAGANNLGLWTRIYQAAPARDDFTPPKDWDAASKPWRIFRRVVGVSYVGLEIWSAVDDVREGDYVATGFHAVTAGGTLMTFVGGTGWVPVAGGILAIGGAVGTLSWSHYRASDDLHQSETAMQEYLEFAGVSEEVARQLSNTNGKGRTIAPVLIEMARQLDVEPGALFDWAADPAVNNDLRRIVEDLLHPLIPNGENEFPPASSDPWARASHRSFETVESSEGLDEWLWLFDRGDHIQQSPDDFGIPPKPSSIEGFINWANHNGYDLPRG